MAHLPALQNVAGKRENRLKSQQRLLQLQDCVSFSDANSDKITKHLWEYA